MAPRHGFEPRFTAPKAAVLPLDDRGIGGIRTRLFSLALSHHGSNDVRIGMEASLGRCWAWSSKPVCGASRVAGGFDSHWLPPTLSHICNQFKGNGGKYIESR